MNEIATGQKDPPMSTISEVNALTGYDCSIRISAVKMY